MVQILLISEANLHVPVILLSVPMRKHREFLPVIEAVKKHFDIPVSVNTFKSSVAESSIQAGADLVNDIWGLKR